MSSKEPAPLRSLADELSIERPDEPPPSVAPTARAIAATLPAPPNLSEHHVRGGLREHARRHGSASIVPPAAARARRKRPPTLHIEIWDELDHALAVRAANERVSKTYLVLHALKAIGFEIPDDRLVGDKRREPRGA